MTHIHSWDESKLSCRHCEFFHDSRWSPLWHCLLWLTTQLSEVSQNFQQREMSNWDNLWTWKHRTSYICALKGQNLKLKLQDLHENLDSEKTTTHCANQFKTHHHKEKLMEKYGNLLNVLQPSGMLMIKECWWRGEKKEEETGVIVERCSLSFSCLSAKKTFFPHHIIQWIRSP